MMEFEELQKLCTKVSNKEKKSCHVNISFWNFRHGGRSSHEVSYNFYMENYLGTKEFNTIQLLTKHMESILDPTSDEGVELEE